jgi:quinol monooxygenase YgiN
MIAVIATLNIQEGKADKFEAVFADLAAKVRSNESGNVAYQLCRSRSEPNVYKVLEIYRDEQSLEDHRRSEHFRSAGPELGSVMSGPPHIELLDAVG